MEGRHRPPKAEHPFPDKVELWKLWGTPAVKPFLKSFMIFFVGFSAFGWFWLSLRDEGRGPLGLTLREPEEMKKGFELSKVISQNRLQVLRPKSRPEDPIGAMFFDDGREFVPPKLKNLPRTPTVGDD